MVERDETKSKSHAPRGYAPRGRPPIDDILTPAEWRVVWAAQHGLTNTQIAKKLSISVNAVKFHIANAVSKLNVNNKRELLVWLGAPKASAVNEVATMSVSSKLHGVGQIARTVSNIEKSESWYKEVLGIEHLFTHGSMAFFNLDGVRLMLSSEQGDAKPESILYFRTEDIMAAHSELSERGVEFSNAPHKIHEHEDGSEEWMAFFLDLEGRPLGLMSTVS